MSAALLAQLRRNRAPGRENTEAPSVAQSSSTSVPTDEGSGRPAASDGAGAGAGAGEKPVPLTGSAALLARMRRNNIPGDKRRSAADASQTSGAAANGTPENGEEKTVVYVLHGGEMAADVGQRVIADAVATHLSAGARERTAVECMCMDKFGSCMLDSKGANKQKKVAIIVVETVENAQPAEAAGAMVRHFNRMRKQCGNAGEKPLRDTFQFAVLGVGDTNLLMDRQTTSAKDCNQAAQTLDGALLALGAEQLLPRGEANDATGLEGEVEGWVAKLWPALEKACMPPAAPDVGPNASRKELMVLYGSQTGNSMEIAQNISAEAPSHGIRSSVKSLEDFKLAQLVGSGAVVLVVISSTGDGDAPDNAARFFTQLKRKSNADDMLRGVQFSVLGMGDQNYSAFMAVPRMVNRRLLECGADVFYKRGEVDEVEGIEQQVEKWLEGFWDSARIALDAPVEEEKEGGEGRSAQDATEAHAGADGPSAEKMKEWGVPALAPCTVTVSLVEAEDSPSNGGDPPKTASSSIDAAHPFRAPVIGARVMTAKGSDRRVIHVDVGLGESGITYAPGDSFGVIPENDPEAVRALLVRLKLVDDLHRTLRVHDGDLPHIKRPCTLFDAFIKFVDISSAPRKNFLRMLGEYASAADERADLLYLCSRSGRTRYKDEVMLAEPCLLELLDKYPSCSPPLQHLLELMPPLMPRMYSVSCSQSEHPTSAQFAFSVVRVPRGDNHVRLGVATNWMDRLCAPLMSSADGPDAPAPRQPLQRSAVVSIPVFHRAGGSFRLPDDDAAPIIMIGPGTGVAPFRGFLQERRWRRANSSGTGDSGADGQRTIGDSWLFFGCRRKDEDYLYESDFAALVADGTLSRLDVAFSRETEAKTYVQHKMKENASELRAWILHRGASVFVCGDGAHMAKDVHAALVDILFIPDDNGGSPCIDSEAAALAYLKQMQADRRYIRDIWS